MAALVLVWASLGIGFASTVTASTPAPYAWGWNSKGQLGDGNTINRNTPTPMSMPTGVNFTSIAAGTEHACALTPAGDAYCWGDNYYGQLGDGTYINRNIPAPVTMPAGITFTSISAGGYFTCALTNAGAAYCWGSGINGQIGNGANFDQVTPVLVSGGLTFTVISGGFVHVCARTTAGAGYCWGDNDYGQLGDGTNIDRNTPTVVSGGLTFASITSGLDHTCALASGGASYCWGRNDDGQLGNGTSGSGTNRNTPTAVTMPAGVAFTAVSAGGFHTCALTAAGTGYCWGDNSAGQLGDGTTISRNTPTPVLRAEGVTANRMALGAAHSCALTESGTAYCSGDNSRGQLGNGTFVSASSAVLVSGGYVFANLSSGSSSDATYGIGNLANTGPGAIAFFVFTLPDGRECASISPMRVEVGAMVTLPGVDALCRTMPGATVHGWTIPVEPGFTGYGSSRSPFPPGLPVLVVDSQRFTVVPYEPTLTFHYDANVADVNPCVTNNIVHTRDRIADVWVPRADVGVARFPTQAACTPPGHSLSGWSTRGDGTGTTYPPGMALPTVWATASTNTRTLFAIWRAN